MSLYLILDRLGGYWLIATDETALKKLAVYTKAKDVRRLSVYTGKIGFSFPLKYTKVDDVSIIVDEVMKAHEKVEA